MSAHSIRMFVTRKLVDLQNPMPDAIDIRDIAHGLAGVKRFIGHAAREISVAEHSLYVSDLVPEEEALEALLHDASEAYLGDVSSPLKSLLPWYVGLETMWMLAICRKFGLGPYMSPAIKEADALALEVEMSSLVLCEDNRWGSEADFDQKRYSLYHQLRSDSGIAAAEWERRFLFRFYELMADRLMARLDAERGR